MYFFYLNIFMYLVFYIMVNLIYYNLIVLFY